MRYYILSGTYQSFCLWCQGNPTLIRPVRITLERCLGLKPNPTIKVIVLDDAWMNVDYHELINDLYRRGFAVPLQPATDAG